VCVRPKFLLGVANRCLPDAVRHFRGCAVVVVNARLELGVEVALLNTLRNAERWARFRLS